MNQALFCGIVLAEALHNHGQVTTMASALTYGMVGFLISLWFVRDKAFTGAVKNSKAWCAYHWLHVANGSNELAIESE